uniref:S1-like domain-containing protein n=1 Tax=Paramoeba aestuarina TaxID=180227 RepID=A0A7S4KQJ8_9EUKA|mmetsp:Transcript_23253/g.36247  ORF Transcript_23253/g.36247 Transcript_23253/m.36247 type:complete len:161 (+) Transcript_23253:90-572(+)|eukprot:CAMPEP_0201521004 /NCGR_PEP_ID=MMETSP0161_2-20130828/13751_1 /ASSEMBLY_ACC=CAM_ASM_000251 /TAXON_ID=180227 /ORGANISM="Neoparamoeba aestuarina, Strain SoJaBio B1-5/56/2" /LENGTH=160 /DNA_ID=CAMNT_0047919555 /DNA_START=102 /DNA_END=584 /DNA_ORIENTATION=+
MPKNKGKGGKSKRKGKNKNDEGDKRELLMKEEGQEYAQVVKMLGNCRFEAFCFDGQTRIGHVRGKFRKKVWINRDDIILVGLRDFQDDKCDVIHRYTADEARRLKNKGELPAKTRIGVDPTDDDMGGGDEFDVVNFDDVSEDEEESDDEEEPEEIDLDDL